MKKVFLIALFFMIFICMPKSYAAVCDGDKDYCNSKSGQEKVNCWAEKVAACNNAGTTLSSEINRLDTQIYLTQARIAETEAKIVQTEKEIGTLGSRIEGLDTSLNYLSKLLLEKVVQGYKQRSTSLLDYLFDAGSETDFLSKVKYLKTTQNNNQKIIIQVQQAKLNFEEQKTLREQKKNELDELNVTLEQQKGELTSQQNAKKILLAETRNSEAVYQGFLEKARAELAGFSAFASAAGGGLTSFGTGSNGWYYTQRDPAWGEMTLPGSSYNLATAGCAVTSVAMVCKSYGEGTTPATIAGDSSRFIYGDLWNWAFSCSGKSTSWIGTSRNDVKSYTQSGTPVILRLYAASVSGLHFIVAYGWDDGRQDFKIHDPYYGPDKYFSDQYSWDQVTTAIVIH